MTRVLLVDDVYTARSMIERVLRHVGRYDVVAAGSGGEALDLAIANPPDAIVLDISMSGLDGLSTLRELRAAGIACPIIAYTARVEQTNGEFVAQGFTAYVLKNGNLSGLLTTLRELLH